MEPTTTARRVLEAFADSPLPDWPTLEAATRLLSLERGDRPLRTGQRAPYVYCVREGLLKLIYETADGTEWIKSFAGAGGFFASANALEADGRSTFGVVALESSRIERLEYPVIERLARAHPVWQRLLTRAFRHYGARKEERERQFLTLTAEERYQSFLRDSPHLVGRVPQKDLARYLGVTPVGLSRIKHRLAEPARRS